MSISNVPANALAYQQNYREWFSSYSEQGEPIEFAYISGEVTGGATIAASLDIINYKYYNDLWHRKLGSPVLSMRGRRTTLSFNRESAAEDLTSVNFTYRINHHMMNVERYPATFLTEFSTIGGILALF